MRKHVKADGQINAQQTAHMANLKKSTDRRTPQTIAMGERIRIARIKKGFTAQELGSKIGVTENAVTQYETGRATPRPQRLQSLADELGVEPTWILTGNDPDELRRAQTVNEQAALDMLRSVPLADQPALLAALAGLKAHFTKKS